METNRVTGQGQLPSQVTGTQAKSGEEAFQKGLKSEGYSKDELEKATTERTRLTRARRVDKGTKKDSSLFLVSDNDDELDEPVYRTVMVDGVLFTLRLLAVA